MNQPTRTGPPAEAVDDRAVKPDVAADLVRLDDDGGRQIADDGRGCDGDGPNVCAVVNSVSLDTRVQSSQEHQ